MPHPQRGALVPRQLSPHEVDEVAFQLDDLLAGSGPRGLDITRKGEGTGAEVHGGDRLAGIAEQVDHMPNALDVLEKQLRRVVEVHLRLGRAIHHQLKAARCEPIGFDDGCVSAQFQCDRRMLRLASAHAPSLHWARRSAHRVSTRSTTDRDQVTGPGDRLTGSRHARPPCRRARPPARSLGYTREFRSGQEKSRHGYIQRI